MYWRNRLKRYTQRRKRAALSRAIKSPPVKAGYANAKEKHTFPFHGEGDFTINYLSIASNGYRCKGKSEDVCAFVN